MGREIKFRAWDIESKKYTTREFIISGCVGTTIEVMGISCDREEESCNEDVVIEQLTGLKDKNGLDIYEGDIVQYYPTYKKGDTKVLRAEQVYWMEFRGCWATKRTESANNDLFRCLQYGNEIEIIGNIHQNPDLI